MSMPPNGFGSFLIYAARIARSDWSPAAPMWTSCQNMWRNERLKEMWNENLGPIRHSLNSTKASSILHMNSNATCPIQVANAMIQQRAPQACPRKSVAFVGMRQLNVFFIHVVTCAYAGIGNQIWFFGELNNFFNWIQFSAVNLKKQSKSKQQRQASLNTSESRTITSLNTHETSLNNPQCPICRLEIIDIIRFFKTWGKIFFELIV